jgi:DNA-binding MarR family transcriptional regulator
MSTAASRSRLNDAIGALNRFASSRKLDAVHAEQAGIDLNLAAWGVLGKVVAHGPVDLSTLARLAHMQPSALSRQVRLLEDAGHITRSPHPDDARVSVVRPTAAGRDAHRRMHDANDELLVRQLRDWSTDELDHITALLERLVADLRR